MQHINLIEIFRAFKTMHQIASTKFQINDKFKISMFETGNNRDQVLLTVCNLRFVI
jgi:hypothetical protein